MDKRVRSPNYPALSLPEAINKVADIYRNNHSYATSREAVAKAMGYTGLNGASSTAVSALNKYGLLERVGPEEIKVSERAMRILHPNTPDEKAEAIRDAAREPELFLKLSERFPDKMPSDEVIRNFLIREGFAPSALSAVITAYRDTSDMVERDGAAYNQAVNNTTETAMYQPATPIPASIASANIMPANERPIGRYDFEGGAYVRIALSGDIDTDTGLEMAQTIIDLKRKELARRTKSSSPVPSEANSETENP